MQILSKNVVPTSQKTPCVFTTNAVRLMQCSYILAVYRDICAEHAVCAEYINVTVGVTHVVTPAFG